MDFPFKSKTHLTLVLIALTKNVVPLTALASLQPCKCPEVELCRVLGPIHGSETESVLQHFATCRM